MHDFMFKFQQYPFGEYHHFVVRARDQEEANERALKKFEEMFEQGITCMTQFYPVAKHVSTAKRTLPQSDVLAYTLGVVVGAIVFFGVLLPTMISFISKMTS